MSTQRPPRFSAGTVQFAVTAALVFILPLDLDPWWGRVLQVFAVIGGGIAIRVSAERNTEYALRDKAGQ